MKTFILTAASFFLIASNAAAQTPESLPPSLNVVRKVDSTKRQIWFRSTVYRAVPVMKVVEVVENGATVKKTISETALVPEEIDYPIDAANSRIITPDGKQVPIDDVWKRLKENTVVAISADRNTPAAAYLRALSPKTLVIIAGPFKK